MEDLRGEARRGVAWLRVEAGGVFGSFGLAGPDETTTVSLLVALLPREWTGDRLWSERPA